MTLGQAVIFGILQGLTEFLPISSSGHLVLLQSWFGLKDSQMLFYVFLHLGTLFAVVVYFSGEIVKIFRSQRKKLFYIIIAMIPAAAAGIFFSDFIKNSFRSPLTAGYLLVFNGLVLMAASVMHVRAREKKDTLGIKDAVFIGLCQVLGLMPGISRSGMTISGGLLRRINYKEAVTFSFLLSVVAIFSAVAFELITENNPIDGLSFKNTAAGLFAAFVSGIISIGFVMSALRKRRFWAFGVYSIVLGVISILLFESL